MASLISATSQSIVNLLGTANIAATSLSEGMEYAAFYITDARRKQQIEAKIDSKIFLEITKRDKAKELTIHHESISNWLAGNSTRTQAFNEAMADFDALFTETQP